MKIKDNYVIQNIADEYIVVPIGEAADRTRGVIKISVTGAFLWDILTVGNPSIDDLVLQLCREFGIDESTARDDISDYIQQLENLGCIE